MSNILKSIAKAAKIEPKMENLYLPDIIILTVWLSVFPPFSCSSLFMLWRPFTLYAQYASTYNNTLILHQNHESLASMSSLVSFYSSPPLPCISTQSISLPMFLHALNSPGRRIHSHFSAPVGHTHKCKHFDCFLHSFLPLTSLVWTLFFFLLPCFCLSLLSSRCLRSYKCTHTCVRKPGSSFKGRSTCLCATERFTAIPNLISH